MNQHAQVPVAQEILLLILLGVGGDEHIYRTNYFSTELMELSS
jgi:hypothetical protein